MPRKPLKWPMVMLVVGVNGVGKTTTIGKLAMRFKDARHSVVLAAADTFRAAAADQLQIWAERAQVPIVRHAEGADPAAVVFDGIQEGEGDGGRSADRRYGGPPAQQEEPDGRTAQDLPRHHPRIRRG